MARQRQQSPSIKRESPIQFRPGTELGQLVTEFSAVHSLSDPEACRCLIALAVTGLDGRYYGLVRQFSDEQTGGKDFVRACIQIKTMLDGAALASEKKVREEPNRSLFILQIVENALLAKGVAVDKSGLWFVRETPPAIPQVEATIEHQSANPQDEPKVKRHSTGAGVRRQIRDIKRAGDDLDGGSAREELDELDSTAEGHTQPVKTRG